MSARDVIASIHYKPLTEHTLPIGILFADCVLEALTAAGFSIVHKDEIHAPSVAELPETRGPYDAVVCKDVPADCCDYGVISLSEGREVCRVWREQDARAIAAALRELMKEVG